MLDLLFLHPPSVYDFRKKIMITGPLATLTPEYTSVFTSFPVGLMSMAGCLRKAGYGVKIVNLGARMLASNFDVEGFLRKQNSKIFGIDLHWCVHSQGAVEIAKLCKRLHPDSLTVLGGLTATRFDLEIMEEHPYVDVVVRGEGETPTLKLAEKIEKGGEFSEIPNLTYRNKNGHIKRNEAMSIVSDINTLDFSDLDVLDKDDLINVMKFGRWCLPVCRGCIFNCVTCGGSAYSYRTLMKRETPGFRSPNKILEDINTLTGYGIKRIFLFQDIRMGGKTYQEQILRKIRTEHPNLENLTVELFYPATADYIGSLKNLGVDVYLTVSPESGAENVRKAHGRNYSNQELLDMIKLCGKYNLKLGIFFMIGLAQENEQTVIETLKLCSETLKHKVLSIPLIGWGCMLLLDPGSLAFDFPSQYGYKLLGNRFKDYYNALSAPSWKYYLTYETNFLSKEKIVEIFMTALDKLASLMAEEKTMRHMAYKHLDLLVERFALGEVDSILKIEDEKERRDRLEKLVDAANMYHKHIATEHSEALPKIGRFKQLFFDHYDYKKRIGEILASELAHTR